MNTEKEIIVVTGATGNIGQHIVAGLIAKNYAPRVVVRKLETSAAWDDAGIVQKVADLKDADSLAAAFAGAGKVFSISPLVENLVELGAATVAAAKRAGVKHIVRSSAQGADVDAPIALGRWHGAVEKMIEDSGLEWTFVQPNSFIQNYLGYADTIKNQNAFYAPLGDGKISLVDARDIAAVAVAALTEDAHAGKKYVVTGGESLSNQDIAEIFTDVLGREIKYFDAPDDTARRQMIDSKMPAWMVDAVMELNQIGKAGYVAEVSPTVAAVTGRQPRTFRRFVEENKLSFA